MCKRPSAATPQRIAIGLRDIRQPRRPVATPEICQCLDRRLLLRRRPAVMAIAARGRGGLKAGEGGQSSRGSFSRLVMVESLVSGCIDQVMTRVRVVEDRMMRSVPRLRTQTVCS